MKKLLITAIVLVGMTSFAQEKKVRPERAAMEQMTSEQKNQLQLKKMTLALDLSNAQQQEMSKIIEEQSTKREARIAGRKSRKALDTKQPSASERFAKQSQMLDEQIILKDRLKKVLTTDQFKKWEDLKSERRQSKSNRMAYHMERKAMKMGYKK